MLIHAQSKSRYCRRGETRRKWCPGAVAVWGEGRKTTRVSAIEVDTRGARLLLPHDITVGDLLHVSFADDVGHYQSYQARVVWTHEQTFHGKVVAGLKFLGEVGERARGLAAGPHQGARAPIGSNPSWGLSAA